MRSRSKSLHARLHPLANDDDDIFKNSQDDSNLEISLGEKRNTHGWSNDDERTLIENIKKLKCVHDKKKFTTQIKHINWEEVVFCDYTPYDCEEHFDKLVKSVRTYRILSEIIADVEVQLVKMPFKKPPTSYHLYIKDMIRKSETADFATIARGFKGLSPKERKKYDEQAQKIKGEFNVRVKEFYKENPKTAELIKPKQMEGKMSHSKQTPFKLFTDYNNLLGNKLPLAEMRNEFTNLSIEAKYKWIEKSIKMYPNIEYKEFLNKEEIRILTGKFKKPPTAYALYVKDLYNEYKDDNKTSIEKLSAIAVQWKNLDPSIKSEYERRAGEEKESLNLERKSFVEKHDIAVEENTKKKKSKKSKASNAAGSEGSEPTTPLISVKGLTTKSKKTKVKLLVEKQVKVPANVSNKLAKKKMDLTTSSISSSASSSDPETKANQKKKSKNVRNISPLSPPPPPSVTSLKRKRNADSESQSDVGSPFKRRLTTTASPTRQLLAKKDSQNVNGKRSSQEIDSASDNQSPKRAFKREESLEINDTNGGVVQPLHKPPATVFEYYLEFVYKGKASKAKKTYESLKKADKKSITIEYNRKVENYVKQLKTYLSSLSKEDAVKYINKIKNQEKGQGDSSISSSNRSDASIDEDDTD